MSKSTKSAAKSDAKPASDHLKLWAIACVIAMTITSALLNGHANTLKAAPAVKIAAMLLGWAIPVFTLGIFQVAGIVYRRGYEGLAKIIGGIGACLLALSIKHCAVSIALLTGSSEWLALPMAVAIDAGLVACKVAALLDAPKAPKRAMAKRPASQPLKIAAPQAA